MASVLLTYTEEMRRKILAEKYYVRFKHRNARRIVSCRANKHGSIVNTQQTGVSRPGRHESVVLDALRAIGDFLVV